MILEQRVLGNIWPLKNDAYWKQGKNGFLHAVGLFPFPLPSLALLEAPRLLGRMTTELLLWVHLALCFSTPVRTWFKFTCRNLTVPIRMGWEAEDPLVCLWGFSVTLDTAQPALPSETEDQRLSWPCSHRLKRPPLAPHPSPRVWVCFSP